MLGELHKSVGQALVAGARIVDAGALGQGLQGRHQDRAAGRVQHALQPQHAVHVLSHIQAATLS
jgi:hypothetical protein